MDEKKITEIATALYRHPHPLFGLEHGLHVMGNARQIAEILGLSEASRRIVLPAAALHDVAFFDGSCLETHGLAAIPIIRDAMEPKEGYSTEEIDRIVLAAARHSRPAWQAIGSPGSLEEKVIFDADQIEWMNVRGILKYGEIAHNAGIPHRELMRTLPGNLAARYNQIFLDETRIIVNADFLKVMESLGARPDQYVETPRVFEFASTHLPTKYGAFTVRGYVCNVDPTEAVAVVKGNPSAEDAPVVRIHSECMTGEVLYSERCDCRLQLKHAMQFLETVGNGAIIYLKQEGRGIGLMNKLKAYDLQENGLDTVDANLALGFHADERDYRIAAWILKDLGITNVSLITNNPDKIAGLVESGITVEARIPSQVSLTEYMRAYMETKKERLGHLL